MTVVGASMLWVGWFGFNAGSELAADGTAGMAMTVTQLATATAALTWMFAEWMNHGKPSVLGIATGAVAGLVAITPASGTAGPMGAIVIGFAGLLFAFIASTKVKRAWVMTIRSTFGACTASPASSAPSLPVSSPTRAWAEPGLEEG